MLKGIDAVAVPEAPIREGSECGAAAPMKLISVGRNPPVALSPPPVVTCDLIAALSRWMARDIQPLARKHLGTPVVRIETMSSYSCRNAYGRKDSRLSEHGRANAVDIGAFVTGRGQAALVVADWGPTAREAAEQAAIARAQIEQERAQASASKFARPLTVPQGTASSEQAALVPVAPASQGIMSGATISIPGLSINIGGASIGASTGFGLAAPSRLGGPKPAVLPQVLPALPAVPPLVKTQFLHAAHRSACKVFGTVLGPEANKAHKNHFHIDMAERKTGAICD